MNRVISLALEYRLLVIFTTLLVVVAGVVAVQQLPIDAVPDSRAMIWEHIEDAPGKPCPNPRVILPRKIVPNVVTDPVSVDIRSFGVRTPPCTKANPSYGIMGLFHVLPPAGEPLWAPA